MERILNVIKFFGIFLVIYGGLAFTGWGPAILDQIPGFSPVNWPMGTVSGVVQDSTGRYVAPNSAYGRVQVYDQDKNFITGWYVENDGGNFDLRMNKNDQVEVFSVRKHRRFVYNLDGTLVNKSDYSPNDYPNLEADTTREYFPTKLYLLPFTGPFLGWFTALLGIISISLAGYPLRRKKRKRKLLKRDERASERIPCSLLQGASIFLTDFAGGKDSLKVSTFAFLPPTPLDNFPFQYKRFLI